MNIHNNARLTPKDRSSRPHRPRAPTPTAIVERIEALRRRRWTGKQIAAEDAGASRRSTEHGLTRRGLALVFAGLAGGILGVARRLAEGFVGNHA
jgi:hypothetical protein